MAISYIKTISKIERNRIQNTNDVVTNIEYKVTGTDDSDNVSGTWAGMCTFIQDQITINDNFIDYNDLTESQVLEWINNHYVDNQEHAESLIQRRILLKRELNNEVLDNSFPWS